MQMSSITVQFCLYYMQIQANRRSPAHSVAQAVAQSCLQGLGVWFWAWTKGRNGACKRREQSLGAGKTGFWVLFIPTDVFFELSSYLPKNYLVLFNFKAPSLSLTFTTAFCCFTMLITMWQYLSVKINHSIPLTLQVLNRPSFCNRWICWSESHEELCQVPYVPYGPQNLTWQFLMQGEILVFPSSLTQRGLKIHHQTGLQPYALFFAFCMPAEQNLVFISAQQWFVHSNNQNQSKRAT